MYFITDITSNGFSEFEEKRVISIASEYVKVHLCNMEDNTEIIIYYMDFIEKYRDITIGYYHNESSVSFFTKLSYFEAELLTLVKFHKVKELFRSNYNPNSNEIYYKGLDMSDDYHIFYIISDSNYFGRVHMIDFIISGMFEYTNDGIILTFKSTIGNNKVYDIYYKISDLVQFKSSLSKAALLGD